MVQRHNVVLRALSRSLDRITPLMLTICILSLASPSVAQNPVDPANSSCETLCSENVIVTTPFGPTDDLGHLGIVVTCLDGAGQPIEGIPPDAFSLDLPGGGPEKGRLVSKADEPTDEEGKIFLTGLVRGSYTLVHTSVNVLVDYMGDVVVIDNGGVGTIAELRSPDLVADGVIDLSDLVLLSSALDCCAGTEDCLRADFDGDGCVTLADVSMFAQYWGMAAKTPASPINYTSLRQPDPSLFIGCIQRDFDTDGDPGTINSQFTAVPGVPFNLKIVAKDYDRITGVRVTMDIPSGVMVLQSMPAGPFTTVFPTTCLASQDCFVAAGPCVTTGPLFVRDYTLMTTTVMNLTTAMFTLVDASFTNCHVPPQEADACQGSPTPCEDSRIGQGDDRFVTCPGQDMDLNDTVTLTMRDGDGNPVPGLLAADFDYSVFDQLGSNEGNRFRLTPLATATDANGELGFRFEARQPCSWDGCFDLEMSFTYQACTKTIEKKVRTPNLVPLRDDPTQTVVDLIDLQDVGAVTAALFTLDPCMDLLSAYRCPLVTAATAAVVGNHLGHTCNATWVPPVLNSNSLMVRQNTPNPFNPGTVIEVVMPKDVPHAQLAVFDVNGRLVSTLWADALGEGPRSFYWDGKDANGRRVSSGVYLARLMADGYPSQTRKMALVK